jgi:hypothetical protein
MPVCVGYAIIEPAISPGNTMKLKGIVRGQVIELPLGTELPDGTEVTIDVEQTAQHRDVQERLAKIQQLFGCWRDQPDLMEIFAQIDRDRHADLGRSAEGR